MAIKQIGVMLLRVSVSILLLAFLFSRVDGRALWQLVRRSDLIMLVCATAIVGLINALCLLRWNILLKASGVSVPFRPLLRSFSGGLFFNIFLPTSIGGDIVRMLDLANHTKKAAHVVSTVFLDRLLGYVALVIVVLCACFFGWSYVQDSVVLFSVGILAVVLICLLFVLFNPAAYNLLSRLLNSPNAGRIRTVFVQAHEQLYMLGRHKKAWSDALLISFSLQLLSAVTSYLICRSLGADISILYFFILMPIIGTISMVPVSLGGLGVREAATVYFFAKAGLARDTAFAMSLVGFFIIVVFAAAGGLYYVLTVHRRRV